jgi:DNA-binding transcriptional LysR family regulator
MRDSTDCEARDFRPSWMAALSLLTMSAGVHGASLYHPRIELEQFNMVAQAAIAGLGVAIVPAFLARQDFASGALVPLFDPLVNERRGDYLA